MKKKSAAKSGRIKKEIFQKKGWIYLRGQLIELPARKTFEKHFRESNSRGIGHEDFTALIQGKTVRWDALQVLAEMLNEDVQAIADGPLEEEPGAFAWISRGWGFVMVLIYSVFQEILSQDEAMALAPLSKVREKDLEEDLQLFTTTFMSWVGRYCEGAKENGTLTEKEAVSRGERHLRKSHADILTMYQRLWHCDHNSLRFAVTRVIRDNYFLRQRQLHARRNSLHVFSPEMPYTPVARAFRAKKHDLVPDHLRQLGNCR